MQLRQVQADAPSRRRMRKVRRRGHPVQSAPRADGAYRPRRAGRAHLVSALAALAYRHPARHDAQGAGENSLLRELCRRRCGRDHAPVSRAFDRAEISRGQRTVRRRLQGRDGRGGDSHAADPARTRQALGRSARRDEGDRLGSAAQEDREAPQSRQCVPRIGQQAGMDDPYYPAGHSARSASAGSARRRPVRHLRPQRSVSARHQPQQPPQAADRAERSRHHHPQRKADAAGSRRCAVRQRPPRSCDHRAQQAPAQVALRHAQGQVGTLPAKPPRQARRLLGPLRHRGRPRAAAASVRTAQEDGARAVQAVHLQQARRKGLRHDHQERQEDGRERGQRRLGHPR